MAKKSNAQIQKEQLAEFREKKRAAELAKKKKERKILIIVTVLFAVIVIASITGIIMTKLSKDNGNFYREKIAFTSEHHKINYAEFSCFVYEAYTNYKSLEGDLSYYGLDETLPFEEQKYNEGITWEDFFINQATDDVSSYLFLADKAYEDNFKLSDEKLKEIDNKVTAVSDFSVYGRGVNATDYKNMLTLKTLAQEYETHKKNSPTFTEAQILEHYNTAKASFDEMDYVSFYVPFGEGEVFATSEDAQAAAQLIRDMSPINKETLLASAKNVFTSKGVADKVNFDELISENTFVKLNETGSKEFQDWAYSAKVNETAAFVGQTAVEVCLITKIPTAPETWKSDAETALRNTTYDGWYADGIALATVTAGSYTHNEMISM